MKKINFFEEIVPGVSAGGFTLGDDISDYKEITLESKKWDSSQLQIQIAVQNESQCLHIPDYQIGVAKEFAGDSFYFYHGAIKTHFNHAGILDLICLKNGYKGKLYDSISVGDYLFRVNDFFEIEYDDTEELHFPKEDSLVQGIIFQAEELSIEESPDQIITSIFVVSID